MEKDLGVHTSSAEAAGINHTPWRINPKRNISSWAIEDAKGNLVANCSFRKGNREEAYAHAQLIVSAVNAKVSA